MTKYFKYIVALIVFVLILSGVIIYKNQNPAVIPQNNSSAKTKVRIGVLNLTAAAPYFVAKNQGFFEKNFIEVDEKSFATTNLVVESIVKGDVDIAFYSTPQAAFPANQISPGKFKIFATPKNNPSGADSLIVKTNSSISNLADLKGKEVGVFPGSTGSNLFRSFFKNKNISLDGIEFAQLAPADQLTALEAGSIDALFSYEPVLTTALQTKNYRKISDSIIYEDKDSPVGLGLISTDFIQKNPQAAKKIVSTFDQAQDFISSNDTKTRDKLSQNFKLKPEVANNMNYIKWSKNSDLGEVKLQSYVDFLVGLGELKNRTEVRELIYKV